ncbi:hypothetical protein VTG60DRAFT_5524 [Thermothelomyces hinnuleus]
MSPAISMPHRPWCARWATKSSERSHPGSPGLAKTFHTIRSCILVGVRADQIPWLSQDRGKAAESLETRLRLFAYGRFDAPNPITEIIRSAAVGRGSAIPKQSHPSVQSNPYCSHIQRYLYYYTLIIYLPNTPMDVQTNIWECPWSSGWLVSGSGFAPS